MDYGKHLFEKKKQLRLQRRISTSNKSKKSSFVQGRKKGITVKLRNPVRFLEDGDKAKVSLRFRGREMAHRELGMELLKRVEADLIEIGTVEQHPKLEGRQLMMVIAPKKRK